MCVCVRPHFSRRPSAHSMAHTHWLASSLQSEYPGFLAKRGLLALHLFANRCACKSERCNSCKARRRARPRRRVVARAVAQLAPLALECSTAALDASSHPRRRLQSRLLRRLRHSAARRVACARRSARRLLRLRKVRGTFRLVLRVNCVVCACGVCVQDGRWARRLSQTQTTQKTTCTTQSSS